VRSAPRIDHGGRRLHRHCRWLTRNDSASVAPGLPQPRLSSGRVLSDFPEYEEALLNKLLNEMDGLREDTEVLFTLTTNRPDQIELALVSRPGRIDQAIEFPLPDEEGRAKLTKLYARGHNDSNTQPA
jgi:SpoVK/Ycf46/Vps4 family AAA+-type ATPase